MSCLSAGHVCAQRLFLFVLKIFSLLQPQEKEKQNKKPFEHSEYTMLEI